MTEEERHNKILEVFTSEGWKFIVEDISKHYDAINNIDNVNGVEELNKLQGERGALAWFLNLDNWYKQVDL